VKGKLSKSLRWKVESLQSSVSKAGNSIEPSAKPSDSNTIAFQQPGVLIRGNTGLFVFAVLWIEPLDWGAIQLFGGYQTFLRNVKIVFYIFLPTSRPLKADESHVLIRRHVWLVDLNQYQAFHSKT